MTTITQAAPLPRPAYRGDGSDRPTDIPLPPARMPLLRAGRLLKRWRYVSIWSADLMICAARVHAGPAAQEFWAVWDRGAGTLTERTRLLPRSVRLTPGRVEVRDGDVSIDVRLEEGPGLEVVTHEGAAYTWTRKQIVRATGSVTRGGVRRPVEATALIDDNAGYHPRHTSWLWSGGAGRDTAGRAVAWSVIVGLNDSASNSERTVWVDGKPHEVGPVEFAPNLAGVRFAEGAELGFTAEATRARRENLILIRSAYRQPFGRFSGTLPGGIALAEAYGVMEEHSAVW